MGGYALLPISSFEVLEGRCRSRFCWVLSLKFRLRKGSIRLPPIPRVGCDTSTRRASSVKRVLSLITFLVSDVLYFGEGPMAQMQRDPLGAQVIRNATQLLLQVVEVGTKSDQP